MSKQEKRQQENSRRLTHLLILGLLLLASLACLWLDPFWSVKPEKKPTYTQSITDTAGVRTVPLEPPILVVNQSTLNSDMSMSIPLVLMLGGCFKMGDINGQGYPNEQPVHEVCVDDFYLGRYEVTQSLWQSVMGTNPAYFQGGGNYPVESVSWKMVQTFIQRLNNQQNKTYRLPTEAEWEYAARNQGHEENTAHREDLQELAWFLENSGEQTHPVGLKLPNRSGVYDLLGNVREWCHDYYDSEYYSHSPRQNPFGPQAGTLRVVRGGSWFQKADLTRAGYRYGTGPFHKRADLGFRLAVSKAVAK